MKEQSKQRIRAHLLRGAFYLLLLLTICLIPFALGRNSGKPSRQFQKAPGQPQSITSPGSSQFAAVPAIRKNRTLTFADRVAYQRAIEEVYWRHRIWPKERPDPEPSFDEVMPSAQLEKKVEDYLRSSQPLENCWQQPLSAEQLQAEMERMAQHT
ncbi:MAG TPA: hypothetical protein VGH37_10165 [Candidatus Acidoferrum sp.]